MAEESIGNLIPTKIPGYTDDADIQAALRVYHYGDYDYDPTNTNPANLVTPSIAKTVYDIQQDIITLDDRVVAQISNDPPVPGDFPDNVISDGFIWVEKDGQAPVGYFSATSVYTATAPTTNLVNGVIWIKKGSVPLEMYVYNGDTSVWNRVV